MSRELVSLEKVGDVFVLTLNDGADNRVTVDFARRMHEALDEVEQSKGPAALVTIGAGRFFSNGIQTQVEHQLVYSDGFRT
jgi:enoyl-CoA hydratase/carnithine racemase